METTYLGLLWAFLLLILIGFYLICALYIHHKKYFQEIFAWSLPNLYLTMCASCIEMIGSISLGFVDKLGFYYEIKAVLIVFIVYELAHHAHFISNVMRIYRLNVLNKIRNGEYESHGEYLRRKVRLDHKWSAKFIIIYTIFFSSIFVGFALYQLLSSDKGDMNMIYNILFDFLIFFEETTYLIFLLKIRKVKYCSNLKYELYMIIFIWALGLLAPFTTNLEYHFYIVPSRNITLLVGILVTLGRHSKMSMILPLQTLEDPRILIEDFTAYKSFKAFTQNSSNKTWEYYLDFLINISLFKLNPSIEKGQEIYNDFLRNNDIIPEFVSRNAERHLVKYPKDITNSVFNEIEFFILKHLEKTIYPEFKNSPEYQSLLEETNSLY
ncbi:unnamed protein product [Blepharisma stoltei]|uniref:RGS domain-containing protein n=1 Tax=Blepharisma stoltei TaxID=1481888 RepID=A0AAU9K0A2_9CILI|nr:unnamed protein product [Blepharisma stoltei]